MWLGGVDVAILLHKPICLLFNCAPVILEFWPSLLCNRLASYLRKPPSQRFAMNCDADERDTVRCLADFRVFIGESSWPYPVARTIDDQGHIREAFRFDFDQRRYWRDSIAKSRK